MIFKPFGAKEIKNLIWKMTLPPPSSIEFSIFFLTLPLSTFRKSKKKISQCFGVIQKVRADSAPSRSHATSRSPALLGLRTMISHYTPIFSTLVQKIIKTSKELMFIYVMVKSFQKASVKIPMCFLSIPPLHWMISHQKNMNMMLYFLFKGTLVDQG